MLDLEVFGNYMENYCHGNNRGVKGNMPRRCVAGVCIPTDVMWMVVVVVVGRGAGGEEQGERNWDYRAYTTGTLSNTDLTDFSFSFFTTGLGEECCSLI